MIARTDFPGFYLVASEVSRKAQQVYIDLNRVQFATLFFGAFFSSLSLSGSDAKIILAILGAVFLVVSTALAVIIQIVKKERTWYESRAIAESVKTMTWRFITCAQPFGRGLKEEDAEKKFLESLAAIRKERRYLAGVLAGTLNTKPQITDKMREIRDLSVKERFCIYREARVKGQLEWYNAYAEKNRRKTVLFFCMIVVLQIIAIIAAILLIPEPEFFVNIPSILTTLVGLLLAWIQLKRYQELSQSYGIAAQELSEIYESCRWVQSEDELSKYILDAEHAISREHTLWVARKIEI